MKSEEDKNIKSIRERHIKGELAREILKKLAIGGVLIAGLALPNTVQLLDFFGATNSAERRKLLRSVDNMKKKKLVKIYQKNDRDIVEITELGRKKILSYDLQKIKLTRPKKWDGYWRIIIFDIPEKNKKARMALSLKLNEMELYPLQKSVFVCPFECKNEIDFVAEFFRVKKCIKHILAKEIENDELMRSYYNL
ncbi:hypothetical protein C4572_03295 [Candidatus Parcubacteria bacterium]|nr:MAG: hypothetical protein C4572_03295 [Candidatus Parcubacteria bacterium]